MPVHMSVHERTHRSYGSATHGFVFANLLERPQPEFGPGLVEIHVELVCRAPSRIESPIETDEIIMGTQIASLPKGKFLSKSKCYAITALSRRPGTEPVPLSNSVPAFSPEDVQREATKLQSEQAARKAELSRKRADVDAMFRVFEEVVEAMVASPPKLKPIAFDWAAFVAWFASLKAELPTTPDGIEAALAAGHAAAKARFEDTDPWARLEIDWKAFHPDARKLLPEPFYWSDSDDFAPHGNDEGFDVLAEMRRLPHKANFTEETFSSLADHFDHAAGDDAENFDQARYLDFVVAVAFGHIKLKGFCPPWLRDKTTAAIKREIVTLDAPIKRDASGVQLPTWETATAPHRVPKRETLGRLSALLERMPIRAPA